ncbi:protein N-terminal glutamine amidohydrolase-like [Antedon mediterranea]|uniref:protein N-terminal glutamine amidohydrolase-like n=1 Tax=Antedon mediterranea TaxID=105859 RepID=UPI003AF45CCB
MEVSILFNRDECIYTSCYCEENVWKLCSKLQDGGRLQQLKNVYAVFISNNTKMIPIWEQRSAEQGSFVVWDYHVILIYEEAEGCHIYDLDTWLSFPSSFDDYIQKAIRDENLMQQKYHRKFRMVPGTVFLEKFASDRSHMKAANGDWLKPPPTYPCISTAGNGTASVGMLKL